jgi:hypothetical protein
MIVNETYLNWDQSGLFRPDIITTGEGPSVIISTLDAGHPSALFPYQNLRNKYYGLPQSKLIARLQPPVGFSAQWVYQKGFGSSYQLSDESLRQLALGMHLANADNMFYRLAKQ